MNPRAAGLSVQQSGIAGPYIQRPAAQEQVGIQLGQRRPPGLEHQLTAAQLRIQGDLPLLGAGALEQRAVVLKYCQRHLTLNATGGHPGRQCRTEPLRTHRQIGTVYRGLTVAQGDLQVHRRSLPFGRQMQRQRRTGVPIFAADGHARRVQLQPLLFGPAPVQQALSTLILPWLGEQVGQLHAPLLRIHAQLSLLRATLHRATDTGE